MKYTLFSKTFVALVFAMCTMASLTGCTETEDELNGAYGYVQFRLFKNDTAPKNRATRAGDDLLDYLSDACKVRVSLERPDDPTGSLIEQTLVLHSYDDNNAAYGMRSDKLQLLVGKYMVTSYTLYDYKDVPCQTKEDLSLSFTITEGGLIYRDLSADVEPRGKASFRLVKPDSLVIKPTRAAEAGAYPFSDIKAISFTVGRVLPGGGGYEPVNIKNVQVKLEEDFHDYLIGESKYHPQTTSFKVDTVVWLKAGEYKLLHYTTYSDKKAKKILEDSTVVANAKSFFIRDNELNDSIELTIQLKEDADYIKDYKALKKIWDALDGPHWSYYGEAEAPGCNWDFNKDIDMWGDQPGVTLGDGGRVVALSLAGMGARGIVPDAIGQLTELEVLSLGTHDELLGGHLFEDAGANMSFEKKQAIRMDYHEKFLARDVRERLSTILKTEINRDGKLPAIRTSSRISLKDVQFGMETNQIKGISRAMMRLKKLQQFYIANSPITADSFFVDVKENTEYPEFYEEQIDGIWSWNELETLTDVEIYNCVKLDSLPMEMLAGLPELQSLNIACNSGISGEQLKKDWISIIEGKSGDRLQLLYMGYNNLKEFPEYEYLSKMVKLALLDCTNNQIETLHPFGKNINFTKFYLDNNKIKEIPGQLDEDGYKYFFGYYDVELFSCTNNELELVPDVFNAKSVNIMASVDFSYNKIKGFENDSAHHGINAATVSLSYNRLDTMPAVLFKTGSPMTTLVLSNNGMKSIPEGSMVGKYAKYLQTLDLSFNKLSDLPKDLWSDNIPYLYGIDLSCNCFSVFPEEPLDGGNLTILGLRKQRNEQGERILKTLATRPLYSRTSLAALYIGENDIRQVSETISQNLRVLDIKDNPNITINLSGMWCEWYARGYNQLIYDKSQDITGCDYIELDN